AAGSAICLVATLVLNAPVYAQPATAPDRAPDAIEVYTGEIQADKLGEFTKLGISREDLSASAAAGDKVKVEAILSARQAKALKARGINLNPKIIKGVPASKAMRQKALAGNAVYRSYSQPGGIKDELVKTAQENPSLTKLVNLGNSVNGQPI